MRTRQYIRKKPFELNVRQQNFVNEYLIDLNGPKAAIRAGYKPEGAYMQAHRLLKNVKVNAAIQRAKNLRNQRVEISQDQTIQEIARGCFWDVANMVNEDGSLKKFHEMDANTRRAIAGFETETRTEGENGNKKVTVVVRKIKLVDRKEYLELLGRQQGLFKDELMVKHEFSAELARIVGGGIDYSRLTDKELDELNARIAALVGVGTTQREVPAESALLVDEPHKDKGWSPTPGFQTSLISLSFSVN